MFEIFTNNTFRKFISWQITCGFRNYIIIVSYIPKPPKCVHMISASHNNDEGDPENRNRQQSRCSWQAQKNIWRLSQFKTTSADYIWSKIVRMLTEHQEHYAKVRYFDTNGIVAEKCLSLPQWKTDHKQQVQPLLFQKIFYCNLRYKRKSLLRRMVTDYSFLGS